LLFHQLDGVLKNHRHGHDGFAWVRSRCSRQLGVKLIERGVAPIGQALNRQRDGLDVRNEDDSQARRMR
jgi:hypothetical protein